MLSEQEPRRKTSWEQLREQSSNLWNLARKNGGRTRFGHPDELAEHVVFKIAAYVVGTSNNYSAEEIRRLIQRGRHEEVINLGQRLYEDQNLTERQQEKPSIIKDTLRKIFDN